MKTAIWEAVKEPLRLLILAIIPIILTWLGTISAEWAVGIVVALRFIDKVLYEIGKENDIDSLKKGLTGF